MKIAICNELFRGWTIERVFQYVAEIGYDGLEIAPFTLADSVTEISQERRREIRRAAEASGIEIVGLHWLLVKPEGLYLNHPDQTIRRRTREYMEALIHLCADLGGKIMVHGSNRQRTVQEGWDFEKAWQNARETFQACAEVARQRDVFYLIEPLDRDLTNFITTVEEALRMVEEVNHPHFRLIVDSRATSLQEPPVPETFQRAFESGHLYHVHVNDVSGKGPGFGETRFAPILGTLKSLGYERYISVEVFHFEPDPQTIASRSIGYLRGILEALEINFT